MVDEREKDYEIVEGKGIQRERERESERKDIGR